MPTQEEFDELEAEFRAFREEVREQIQGSMDANQPGIASRLQSVEGVISRHDFPQLETRVCLLENNAIQDGQSQFALITEKVSGLSRLSWTIGSTVMLAIVSALIGLVIGK